MERLPAEHKVAVKKHSTDLRKELLIRACRPIEEVSKLERPQLFETIAEQPEGTAMVDPSEIEGG